MVFVELPFAFPGFAKKYGTKLLVCEQFKVEVTFIFIFLI